MQLVIYVAAFLAGAFVAVLLTSRLYASSTRRTRHETQRLEREIFRAHWLYLGLLRREFANAILEPQVLLRADIAAAEYEKKVEEMGDDVFRAEVADFWKRFPNITDFDAICVKHFVKYTDSFAFDDIREDEDKDYLDIVKYMALLCRLESSMGYHRDISTGTDVSLLKKMLARYDDQRLSKLAIEAIKRRRISGKTLFDSYDDQDYSLEYLHEASPASVIGIHIKESNEYVVYESFLSDDNKHYESFYRSDNLFRNRECLDT